METRFNPGLVVLSILVAIFASYTALSLVGSITHSKGRMRAAWLTGGSLAMGFGIWSMHFVGMLAFSMPGMTMGYDLPLMILSIVIAIGASALALYVVSRQKVETQSYNLAAIAMGIAIAGMHYTGMASMRMPARIEWNPFLVSLSVLIAVIAAYGALWIAFRLKGEGSGGSHIGRIAGGIVMGIAISGMHYTGMAAARFVPGADSLTGSSDVIVSSNLTTLVLGSTLLILAMALTGTFFDRALARRTAIAQESTRLLHQSEQALAAFHEERELRERFVSTLTHDLRTPLTAAKLAAQLMGRQLEDPESVRKFSAKVIGNLNRADTMIRDLLDAHRISANQKLPINPEECDIRQLVRQAIDDLGLVHGDRFLFRSEGPVIGWWDCEYLRRLVDNLCGNAVKYGDPGKPVTIAVTPCGHPAGSEVRLSVHNHGAALTATERENLFHLFHRSKSAQDSGEKGWGIGLTLVKGVAESHGGSVQVRSEPGEGTTFNVTLPRDARFLTSSSTRS